MTEDHDPESWARLTGDPRLDPAAWELDALDFFQIGDHFPGTKRDPNEYELLTGRRLTWTHA